MGEYVVPEVNPDEIQRLALRLVYGFKGDCRRDISRPGSPAVNLNGILGIKTDSLVPGLDIRQFVDGPLNLGSVCSIVTNPKLKLFSTTGFFR